MTAIRIVLGDGPGPRPTLGDYRFLSPQGCHPDSLLQRRQHSGAVTSQGEAGDDELFEGPYMIVGVPARPSLHVPPHPARAGHEPRRGGQRPHRECRERLRPGPRADSLERPNVTSTQAGDGGNDVLLGGRVRDALDGRGPGADILDGGSKADSILGGPGGDLMEGGSWRRLAGWWIRRRRAERLGGKRSPHRRAGR